MFEANFAQHDVLQQLQSVLGQAKTCGLLARMAEESVATLEKATECINWHLADAMVPMICADSELGTYVTSHCGTWTDVVYEREWVHLAEKNLPKEEDVRRFASWADACSCLALQDSMLGVLTEILAPPQAEGELWEAYLEKIAARVAILAPHWEHSRLFLARGETSSGEVLICAFTPLMECGDAQSPDYRSPYDRDNALHDLEAALVSVTSFYTMSESDASSQEATNTPPVNIDLTW